MSLCNRDILTWAIIFVCFLNFVVKFLKYYDINLGDYVV